MWRGSAPTSNSSATALPGSSPGSSPGSRRAAGHGPGTAPEGTPAPAPRAAATLARLRAAAPRTVLAVVLASCATTLLLGFLLKQQCTGAPYLPFGVSERFHELKNSHLCYSDIQYLWPLRGVAQHEVPYLTGSLVDGHLVGGAIEYPVLTGWFIWLTGLPAHTDTQFLAVSALALAPFALLTSWLLTRMTGWRALIWAAAPAMVWYAFLNWDLLVTAAATAAIYAWWRGRHGAAAAWLGVGAALKLYPALFVLPLLAERLAAGDRRGAARVAGISAGVFAALNAPVALANPAGWWATYAFQAHRMVDITTNSIWFWGFPQLSQSAVTLLSSVLLALGWSAALAVGWWRGRRCGGGYPWLGVSAAMLSAFLLLNKVHSPQYLLWLLPFFAVIRVRWGWWATYWLFDALLFVGLFQWYAVLLAGGDFGLAKQAVILGVWGRAAMLALLYVRFLTSDSVVPAGSAAGSGAGASRTAAPLTG